MGKLPQRLTDVLDRVQECANNSSDCRVSVQNVHTAIGEKGFGPLLFVPALIELTPIGSIPDVPTFLAVIIVLVAGQVLVERKQFWIPGFIARREVRSERLE